MNRSIQNALHYMTGNANIDEVSVEELQKLAEESPYFPVTRFLLAKKLKAENHPKFLAEVQKTALYFSNPQWLHYQLLHEPSAETATEQKTRETETIKQEEHKLFAGRVTEQITTDAESIEKEDPEPPAKVPVIDTSKGVVFSASATQPARDEDQVDFDESSQETISADHPVTTLFSAGELDAASRLAHDTLQESEQDNDAPPNFRTEEVTQAEEEAATITRNTSEKADEGLAQVTPIEEPTIHDNFEQVVLDALTPTWDKEAIEVTEEMAGVTRDTDEATEKFLSEAERSSNQVDAAKVLENENEETVLKTPPVPSSEEPEAITIKTNGEERNGLQLPVDSVPYSDSPSVQQQQVAEPDEHERMFQNIKAMLDASSEEAAADVKNAIVPIDPYYTIDYFASQGIKLDLEKNPQDQLGKNLKKFTQWLKHMKKLGPEDATEAIIRKETETDIVKIADSSNTVREVVTEAMASVLEKQGKKDKAIELYNKLSFLNPDKSAYFAHKIKNLKGI